MTFLNVNFKILTALVVLGVGSNKIACSGKSVRRPNAKQKFQDTKVSDEVLNLDEVLPAQQQGNSLLGVQEIQNKDISDESDDEIDSDLADDQHILMKTNLRLKTNLRH